MLPDDYMSRSEPIAIKKAMLGGLPVGRLVEQEVLIESSKRASRSRFDHSHNGYLLTRHTGYAARSFGQIGADAVHENRHTITLKISVGTS